jgi:predicted nuclease of restriction endonuclease-like (RecB) superfamily
VPIFASGACKNGVTVQQPAGQINDEQFFDTIPSMNETVLSEEYQGYDVFLREVKTRVQTAQIRAVLVVNSEMVLLYWSIGRDILDRQKEQGWGTKVIDRLSVDLRKEFPTMQGFSPRNLKYIRAFAEAWTDEAFVRQVAAQIPWFHNCVVLDKAKSSEERLWYIKATIENGWSRNVLVHPIESKLYARQGKYDPQKNGARKVNHTRVGRL